MMETTYICQASKSSPNPSIPQHTLICPQCGSSKFKEIVVDSGVHYSKIHCLDCDRFIRWGKNPQTIQRERDRQVLVDRLLSRDDLNDWQRGFLTSIRSQHKLTPKQQQALDKLASS